VVSDGTRAAEDLHDHLADIRAEAGYVVPGSLADELAILEKLPVWLGVPSSRASGSRRSR
jgi:hypothetical protein